MRLVWTLFAHAAEGWLSRCAALAFLALVHGTVGNAAVIEATTLPPAPTPPPTGAKFLFIVETSAAMNRLEHGGRQVVFDLIYSGISNQMQKADSFGVWTFSEEVNAGGYPMQIWSGEKSLEQASKVGIYLKGERYKGKPHAELAIAKAVSLMKAVKDVNVILVTSGESSLGMSELEVKLRDFYQRKAEQARQKRVPVVLSFSSTEGEIATAGVTLAGEPISFREDLLAKAREPLKKSLTPTNEIAKVTPPPPTNHVRPKPIIMIGHPKPPVAAAVPPATPPLDAAEGQTTRTMASAQPDAPAAMAVKTGSPTNGAPPSSPNQNLRASSLAESAAAMPLPAPTTTSPLANTEVPVAKASRPMIVPEPIEKSRVPEEQSKNPEPKSASPAELAKVLASPIKVAAREPQSSEEAGAPAPVVAATLVPVASSDAKWIMLAGAGFFAAALGLSAWVLYRLRNAQRSSFISQSMNRKHSGNH